MRGLLRARWHRSGRTVALAAIALAAFALPAFTPPASAHRLAPSLLQLHAVEGGRFEVLWKTPLVRASGARLAPELPAHCANVTSPRAASDAGSATLRWTVDCGAPGLVGSVLAVRGLPGSGTDAIVRIELDGGRSLSALLSATETHYVVPARENRLSVFAGYAGLGLRHILGGPDHLLFVLGLLLLVSGARQLAGTVTAFTVGHSVTLSLAVVGHAQLPPDAVELAIAVTLFWLALEVSGDAERRSLLGRHPFGLAFGFGLVHGLGFAGALAEAGLPAGEVPLALASFNLGIEVGQLGFVAVSLAAGRLLAGAARAGFSPARAASYAIGSLAFYWCLDRTAALL